MTPQLIDKTVTRVYSHLTGDQHPTGDQHLTGDQMSDLLALPSAPREESSHLQTAAEAHLRVCSLCAAELAGMREALALFRETAAALADREFSHLQSLSRPAFPVLPARGAYPQSLFLLAASAILMAGILPLEMRFQRPLAAPAVTVATDSARPAESDEQLLADIDRELSASVPTPMQALSDPTGYGTSAGSETSTSSLPVGQNSTQRKD
jgi:hypothetical protein